jgi:demethylmenaquinone methyltransferase / 2-methoxy-6-polyprenyl-1,4-benzoquinol methylase
LIRNTVVHHETTARSRETIDVSKSPQKIAGMFDAIAERYDFLNHFLSAGIDKRWRTRAIESLRLTGAETVIDVCTGTADLAIAAATHSPAARRVIGVDFAGAMLGVGATKLRRLRLDTRITLVRGDATRLPAADRSADAVTVAFGIRNVQDIPAACREMRRVLAPGGRLAVLEFAVPTMPGFRTFYQWYVSTILPRLGGAISRHPGAYGYLPASISAFESPEEFVKILRQAGFVDIRPVPLMFGSVMLYAGRTGSD